MSFRRTASKRSTKRTPSLPSFQRAPSLPSLSVRSPARRPRKVATQGTSQGSTQSISQGSSQSTTTTQDTTLNENIKQLDDHSSQSVGSLDTEDRKMGGGADWARDSVSLRALRFRSRRNAFTSNKLNQASAEDDSAITTLSSLHAPAGSLFVILTNALIHPRAGFVASISSTGNGNLGSTTRKLKHIQVLASSAAMHASARATNNASATRRANDCTNAPPPDTVPPVCSDVGKALGCGLSVPSTVRGRLFSACSPSDVEWCVYAAALPVSWAVLHATGDTLRSPRPCLCCARSPTIRSGTTYPGIFTTSRVPGSWPRVGRWFIRRMAHSFPVFRALRHTKPIRTLAACLYKLASDGAVSCRLKCLVGYVYALTVRDLRSAAAWRNMAAERGLTPNLFRAVKAFVSESPLRTCNLTSRRSCLEEAMPPAQQAVLVWAKECASLVGRKPQAIVDPTVFAACAHHLDAQVMAEIAAFVAVISVLGRVSSFYSGVEDPTPNRTYPSRSQRHSTMPAS